MEEQTDKDKENLYFYANHFIFNITGRDVFIDFQNLSPRYGQKIYNVIEHNTIIISTALFKNLIKKGLDTINKLEEKFGDITSPEFLEKLDEEHKKILKELENKTNEAKNEKTPNYFG